MYGFKTTKNIQFKPLKNTNLIYFPPRKVEQFSSRKNDNRHKKLTSL